MILRDLDANAGDSDELTAISADARATLVAERRVIAVVGDYSAGKSTLIKRLLIENGQEVPQSLQVSGSPKTTQAADYPWGPFVLRDPLDSSPGILRTTPEPTRPQPRRSLCWRSSTRTRSSGTPPRCAPFLTTRTPTAASHDGCILGEPKRRIGDRPARLARRVCPGKRSEGARAHVCSGFSGSAPRRVVRVVLGRGSPSCSPRTASEPRSRRFDQLGWHLTTVSGHPGSHA